MADSEAVYLGESKRGDKLRIDVAVNNFTHKGFELYYRLKNETKGCDTALIKTGMVCLDLDAGKPTQVPQPFVEKFS